MTTIDKFDGVSLRIMTLYFFKNNLKTSYVLKNNFDSHFGFFSTSNFIMIAFIR